MTKKHKFAPLFPELFALVFVLQDEVETPLRERMCAPAFFAPYNTRALFRDGVLLELHSWSYPWGPDADPAEPAP